MADTYRNFQQLAENETQDEDFAIRVRERNGTAVIIAPHGGGIEPGTSEIAEAIAGPNLSFYAFEGIRRSGNAALHITSTRFDEPRGTALVVKSPTAIAIHGEDSGEPIVFVGGLDTEGAERLRASLKASGFRVDTHSNPALQGSDPANICNRGTSGRGVQLELSNGLRKTFFSSLTRAGRLTPTKEFGKFVAAVRSVVAVPEAPPVLGPTQE
jgi:phage replication-related protein YjqB (UPF0714/DUF867 family)